MSNPPPTILLVEDEPDILLILRRVIREQWGDLNVLATTTTAEALEVVELGGVALLITDYNMTGHNGLQLIAQAREYTPGLPAILITAYDTADLARAARKASVNVYMAKPFDIELMLAHIGRLLGR